MDEYFIGVVKQHCDDKIIFEFNNHGFIFQGVHLHMLPLNQEIKLYLYFYQRLPISEYFAFINQETKNYFLELIKISYIGPKLALKILNFFKLDQFKNVIINHDYQALTQIKGITNKLALAVLEHFKK